MSGCGNWCDQIIGKVNGDIFIPFLTIYYLIYIEFHNPVVFPKIIITITNI